TGEEVLDPVPVGIGQIVAAEHNRLRGGKVTAPISQATHLQSIRPSVDSLRIKQPDVPLPARGLDEDRLEPLEELPGVEVAVDVGADAAQPAAQLLGLRSVHDA